MRHADAARAGLFELLRAAGLWLSSLRYGFAFGALAAVTLTWRRLGVLRFKNVLTTVALGAFVAPVLWQAPAPNALRAAPMAEVAAPSWSRVVDQLAATPWTHFAGLACAAAVTALLLTARRRSSAC